MVRSPQGGLAVDLRGKAPGRGAYLCPEAERGCLAKGISGGALLAALETPIGDTDRAALQQALAEAAEIRKGGNLER